MRSADPILTGAWRAQSVSIIIPTFNRREPLRRLLLLLRQQSLARGLVFDVHVTVDGSTDGTPEMLASLVLPFELYVHLQPNGGPAMARNRGIHAAQGEVLLFLDDDVIPVDDLIAHHAQIHAGDEGAVVIGGLNQPSGKRLPPWSEWEAMALERHSAALSEGRKPATPHNFYTGNASVRRENALAIGCFNESLRRGEDIEFAYRLAECGARFYFAADAAVTHESDHPLEVWQLTPYQYGRNDVLMARDYGRPHALELSYKHPGGHRMLNRLVARWCVGHDRRMRFVYWSIAQVVRCKGPRAVRAVQRHLCSALFNLQYWRGVADATGLGASVWERPFWLTQNSPSLGRVPDYAASRG